LGKFSKFDKGQRAKPVHEKMSNMRLHTTQVIRLCKTLVTP
jgi:hypothetical protein